MEQLRDMFHSAVSTAAQPEQLELVVRIDSDDRSYDALRTSGGPYRVRWIVGSRVDSMGAMWNDAAQAATGGILHHCADDIRFEAAGWDDQVRAAFDRFPDRIALVYGQDGIHDQRLATHGFLSRAWVDAVGQFLPEHFSSDFNDTWINDVADMLGRRVYVPEIVTMHYHPAVGKGPLDQTHLDRLARDTRDNNGARYLALAEERAHWAERLRTVMTA